MVGLKTCRRGGKMDKHFIVRLLLISLLSMVAFIVLSVFPGFIHRDRIANNIQKSIEYIKADGLYPSNFKNDISFIDNWADSVLLNIVLCQDEPTLQSGISNRMVSADGYDSVVGALEAAYNGEEPTFAYSNYWLGCKLPIKLLLTIFDIAEIRYAIYVFYLLSVIFLFMALQVVFGKRIAISYFMTMVVFATVINVSSLSATFDLLGLNIGTLILLYFCLNGKSNSTISCLYFYGIMCGYWQWVYIPIVLPCFFSMVCFLFNVLMKKKEFKESKSLYFYHMIAWTCGYLFTILSKQLMSQIIINNQIGYGKFMHWFSSTLNERIMAFLPPVRTLLIPEINFLIILFVIACVVLYLLHIVYIDKLIHTREKLFLVGMNLLWPYIWFFILAKATTHGWYGQNFIPVVFAIVYIFLDILAIDDNILRNWRKLTNAK